ncbi:MAG TPA: tryptophan halogenase family protein [Cellvibrionaceae bacterium]
MTTQIKKIVIAGGGTAGWIAAATLSSQLGPVLDICLVESDEISTVGVGEATVPPLQAFHNFIGVDEREFLKASHGTIKLGISFENWARLGDRYIHSFGTTGKGHWAAGFHHFWLKARKLGSEFEFGDFCLELQAAKEGRFAMTENPPVNFAYHFNASLYAKFLRNFSCARGVKRIEGKITSVTTNEENGFIKSLVLASGEVVEGDLFIDCTGFRGLLIEQTLHTGYEDWSQWLINDSAIAAQTTNPGPIFPYTRAVAHQCGWQWHIPLQSRIGTGLVYSSKYISDEDARKTFIDNLPGELINEPHVLKFKAGRRLKAWNKNCVAMGLSSGFIEPLESTSIHLIMAYAMRFLQFFPINGFNEANVEEYNQQCKHEIESIRDFVVLHYKATERDDTAYWRYCRDMDAPKTLAHRIKLFAENAMAFKTTRELFLVDSWTQVMLGQRVIPSVYHPIVDVLVSDEELLKGMRHYSENTKKAAAQLPTHEEFLRQYCPADI